ncbi:UDP-N-acetylglucosamine pyrophosphorylase [Carpediemonas membranifera]|uniref:UDP-N-acetylglucosamine diphosphorylase n=1 Tax=Carpediemonas membranifera TaxID=201153 RepID=A0A8J6BWC7_9EUKA|nr:UDP-N-acetylglucosamine pyrophosphorylase [Carpediemonas membranifera]|eukprot:KAG9392316.1 UDP-N-acetylglucosamine pyrophosphorylase [Carpediemonas membranifera]
MDELAKEHCSIAELDARLIHRQQHDRIDSGKMAEYQPFPSDDFLTVNYSTVANKQYTIGLEEIKEGHVAAVVMAGGMGTRLGCNKPKGTFTIGVAHTTPSIFQIQAMRILALQRKARGVIPYYVMCSRDNEAETRRFFETGACRTDSPFFGLDPSQVVFFTQGEVPCFDLDYQPLKSGPDSLVTAADGNGGLYSALFNGPNGPGTSTAWLDIERRGVRYIHVFTVDNPLTRICDPELVGQFVTHGYDAALKAIPKRGPEEKIGVICRNGTGTVVAEYSELPQDLREATDEDGNLLFSCGNIANHMFTVEFIKKVALHQLPWHIAKKAIPYYDKATGQTVNPPTPNGYKLEQFIFDSLTFADRVGVIMVAREHEFAPIKNAEGEDSPATAEAMVRDELVYYGTRGFEEEFDEVRWRTVD